MSHISPSYVYKGQSSSDLRSELGKPDVAIGVDWLTVAFPCVRQSSFAGWHTKTWKRGPTTTALLHLPFNSSVRNGPYLRLTYIDSPHNLSAYVSFNPSRVLDPLGTGIASTAGALHVLNTMVEPLIPAALGPPPTQDWDLYRLDLACDVETGPHTQQVLHDVVHPMYRPQHHTYVYFNGASEIGTVGRRSVTRPRVSVYDKAAESKTSPPRVRFEVQCRRAATRDYFGGKVAGLDADSARDVFQMELGDVIAPATPAFNLAQLTLTESELKTAYELIGMHTAAAAGIHRPVSRSAQRRHRQFLTRYGLLSVDELL